MNAKIYQSLLGQLIRPWRSFSVVNGEGQLLFSKDRPTVSLTTTRLVAFQIVKKYLKPKPFDLIILNDPENGGFSLTKIIFIASLSENLYLIWDEDLALIDFKIPPTPLFENNQKNSFVWSALVESHPNSSILRRFFEQQKVDLDLILSQKEHIQTLSLQKNQNLWLKASQEIFDIQFMNKALGSAEAIYRISSTQLIKLKITAEERQNLKSMTLDFTNTSLATTYSTSSHVVESGLVQKILQFYQLENYFTQVVLDKIKIILPPKSVVSKGHPQGEWNGEIQSICSQLCGFDLAQMNSQTRKTNMIFELAPELKIEVCTNTETHALAFDSKVVTLDSFENMVAKNQIRLISCQRGESLVRLKFEAVGDDELTLRIRSKLFAESKDVFFKFNEKADVPRKMVLKSKDQIEVSWKL